MYQDHTRVQDIAPESDITRIHAGSVVVTLAAAYTLMEFTLR